MARNQLTFNEFLTICKAPAPPADPLNVLGSGVQRLPPAHWQENMLFFGAPDEDLLSKTGSFPARLRKHARTHPVFVLRKLGHIGFTLCPCTSQRKAGARFIRKGCRLEIKATIMDRNSWLLEHYTFNLSHDPNFSRSLFFMGRVPPACILSESKT